ncbi:c-type cytochrome domain-containing protein [Blastopirellula marina]|uniref:Uncharacterized protein n=1 Tax=Blastopirellula marina DSM 3645 TaxID=314230 RepID=A3ZMN5_9BACT|nr:c-type cytochrome domain-containing protein [Blastopirellula marina]EAQ82208.1 hypothetical protein DSM3645_00800 [Blastopirellula marina DSM 3645]
MHFRILLGVLLSQLISAAACAQTIVDFGRDVQPILESQCLKCHGPEKAKNDFRVDDALSMSFYVEPGDLESSSLWTDYLATEDTSMMMPPPAHEGDGGLPTADLAIMKLWIEEGANYEWVESTAAPGSAAQAPEEAPPLSMAAKIWLFQGLFHPASTHFPIALLSISMAFLALSFFAGKPLESAAFHCLWVGALTAIPACLMGWAYATDQGYVDPFSLDPSSGIDRHRWLGIGVTLFSLALVPIAHSAIKKESFRRKLVWFAGCCVLAVGASFVGFQGGELTYGEGHYAKEYERLFLADQPPVETEPVHAVDATQPVAKQD